MAVRMHPSASALFSRGNLNQVVLGRSRLLPCDPNIVMLPHMFLNAGGQSPLEPKKELRPQRTSAMPMRMSTLEKKNSVLDTLHRNAAMLGGFTGFFFGMPLAKRHLSELISTGIVQLLHEFLEDLWVLVKVGPLQDPGANPT